MQNLRSPLLCLFVSTLLTAICLAEAPDRIAGTIDSGHMVPLTGQVHRQALPKFDQGSVDASFQLSYVTLLTVPSPSQQQALTKLLTEQQDPKSRNFHKWLTPEQYAERFGLSHNDIKKATAWLMSQGLSIVTVARGRNWIAFTGTASQIEAAFQTQIHRYKVDGETHFANAVAPSIPAALSGIATGFRGLDDFRLKPRNIKRSAPKARNARPGYSDSNIGDGDFLAPNDIATIYDLTPLYTAGIDGTGEKLLIVGQTDVYLADLNDFRNGFGMALISGCSVDGTGLITDTACSTSNFQYLLGGPEPGLSLGDLTEADLDLEWSAATARGAQIIFDNSNNVFTSLYDAIDQNRAPVISMSYGTCEFNDNNIIDPTTGNPGADEQELMKANTEGITVLNSSGDSGAAECDPPFPPAVDVNNLANYGLAVSYPASSPEVTGVGGTAIVYPAGFSSTYWGTNNTTNNGGTAQNPPLPETAWNDDVELTLISGGTTALSWQESYAVVQSGGGPSNCATQDASFSTCVSGFPQPAWQTVTVPSQSPVVRYSPDVSLLASPNFPGYIYCTPVEELSSQSPYSGESTSSCNGGITAAINGIPNGQTPIINPSIVGGTSASSPVFAGMVTLLNQLLVSNGLQAAPGMGNINPTLYQLALSPSLNAFHPVTTGSNVVYCAGGTPTDMPTPYQCPGTAGSTGSFGFNASNADAVTGYNLVTGLGSVDANALFLGWEGALSGFTLAANPTSLSVVAGHSSNTTTVTFTPGSYFTSAVLYYCTGAPAGITCAFNPSTATTSNPTLTISTPPYIATGATPITVAATGGGATRTTAVSLTVSATDQSFQLAVGATSLQVTPGQTGTATINVTQPQNGFNSALTFTCSDSTVTATGATQCSVTPSTPTTASSVSVSIPTAAPSAQLRAPLGSSRGIFYAALLPGLLGIVFSAGSRKRAARGLRFLSLILVLGFSTLWLGACSSNSSSTRTPGTPPGMYTVTINATTGGATPVTASTTVTLNVQ